MGRQIAEAEGKNVIGGEEGEADEEGAEDEVRDSPDVMLAQTDRHANVGVCADYTAFTSSRTPYFPFPSSNNHYHRGIRPLHGTCEASASLLLA